MRCENGDRYCNLCHFAKDTSCYVSDIREFRNGVKEAVYFTHPLVPKHYQYENKHNPIIQFDRNCSIIPDYATDFYPYSNQEHSVECIPCTGAKETCAIQYGLNRKESVLKVYSI